MSQLSEEEIARYYDLLETHRRTLAVYVRQQAAIGQAFSPPAVVNGISEARSEIARLKGVLRATGVQVPDGPDDEARASPPVIVAAGHPRAARRVTWAGLALAALGLALIAALLRWGPAATQAGLASDLPTPAVAQPSGASAASLTTPVSSQAAPAEPQLIFSDDFSSGNADGWSGNSDEWSVLPDGAGFVYQGQGLSGDAADSFPWAVPLDLRDYAVELRYRLVQGASETGSPDLYLTIRATDPPAAGCYGYGYAYYGEKRILALARFGHDPCPLKLFGTAPLTGDAHAWHTLRAEIQGERLRLLVDGKPMIAASDSSLTAGGFWVSVARGAVVQLADVRVVTLP